MDTNMVSMDMIHADNPVKMKDHMALMDLMPNSQATHVAIKNGSWFDASIWQGGKVPGDGAHVMIAEGINVRYDGESEARLKTVRLDGSLAFATDQNTQMVVDTLVEMPTGTLTIGTASNPIQADKTARIVIANDGNIDTKWDPTQLSRGVLTHGKVNIYGAEKADFVALAQDAEAGDRELILKQKPSGWRVGDTIVLGGTSYSRHGSDQDNSRFRDEVLTITEISGKRVRFINNDITTGDQGILRFDHTRPDIPEKDQLNLYVANTSRNVVIESENGADTPIQQRGHAMFMHNPDVHIQNAGFYHLGRSDKKQLVDDIGQNVDGSKGSGKNVRGRYGLHLHRTGADSQDAAAVVQGSVVVDSPGWGIVQHDSHAILKDNVVFDVDGAGIVAEAGNELGRWENNITIKTGVPSDEFYDEQQVRNRKFDLGFEGEGYWVQGAAQVTMKDNIAISASETGITVFGDTLHPGLDFRDKKTILVKNLPANIRDRVAKPGQEAVDVTDVPLQQLSGFESYNTHIGMQIWGQMTNFNGQHEFSSPAPQTAHDLRGRINDFKLWNSRQSGLKVFYSSNLDFENGLIVGNVQKPAGGEGLFHNHATFNTDYKNLTIKGFDEGLRVEFLNEEKDFNRSSIANSRLSNNTYNFRRIGDKEPRNGQPDDFPKGFAVNNTVFADQQDNQAPVAKFSQSAAGGLAVSFDAGDSYDSDPLKPDSTSPKYPIDSQGIAVYGWDFNSDGQIDDFGRQVTHVFDQPGTQPVTLYVLDNQGAAATLVKPLEVAPTVYPNAFENGDFSSGIPLLAGTKANSVYSDQGWLSSDAGRLDSGAARLSAVGQGRGAIGQVVQNNQVHQGDQTLSFRLKNLEGSSERSQANELTLQLWGVNGQFDNAFRNDSGPYQVSQLPMERALLYEQTFSGEDDFFDWKRFDTNVDLGDGYQFLAFQVRAEKTQNPGDFVAIDDVKLMAGAPASDSPTPDSPAPDSSSLLPEPIAQLKFDETSGNRAKDSAQVGPSNPGRLIGDAEWTTGSQQGAVAFDGKGDAVRLKNSKEINLGQHGQRTIALEFQANETSGANLKQVIYEEGGTKRGLNIYLEGDQLFVGGWNTPNRESGWQGTWLSTDDFSVNQWNHVALVLDGDDQLTSGALRGYINGEQFGEGEGSQLWRHSGNISLGSLNQATRFHDGIGKSGHGLSGAIDEVMIFNDALSSSQIQELVI